eukprot:12881638-Prorocentrum_lima.AAC.1
MRKVGSRRCKGDKERMSAMAEIKNNGLMLSVNSQPKGQDAWSLEKEGARVGGEIGRTCETNNVAELQSTFKVGKARKV